MTDTLIEREYFPRGIFKDAFLDKSPELLISGPAGTGKSRVCLEKLHFLCGKYPGLTCAMVRKTATSLGTSAASAYQKQVAKDDIAAGKVRFYRGSGNKTSEFQYDNGSTIKIFGMEKEDRVMSADYDFIYVQEATDLNEGDWETLTIRCRENTMGWNQVIADCNPKEPHHWLKRRADSGKIKMVNSRHEDNPTLYDDGDWTDLGKRYVLGTLHNATGVKKQRLLYGRWVAQEGLIYDGYNPEIHLIDSYKTYPSEDWPRYWSVDFGTRNPFVCQFWAVNPDGDLILYREIYKTDTLIEEHCDAIQRARRFNTKKGIDPMPVAVICDHDAQGRMILEAKLGIQTVPAHKPVLEGIDQVKARLTPPDGKRPRIYICRDALIERDEALYEAKKATCTEQEISEYVWELQKEAPKKESDHGMDAMRYMVMHLDWKKTPNFHVITY